MINNYHIKWTKNAASELKYWQKKDPKVISRIKTLILDIQDEPFTGIGKPEPLKYSLSGYWSRRITSSHRLVYRIDDKQKTIIIIQCRYHY